ncbi:hypothetical protein Tco_0818566 [Tanacetum coccineum]
MLTKPQVFYDDTHKQALSYQNSFYLKKAHRIKPTLYDGSVISSQHAVIPVIDDEETLILEEVSRSKMLAKQNDPILKEKKINTTPINYVELNRLSEDFGKHFIPQQELSAEQVFWLQTSHPNTDQSATSPVKIEAPMELPKCSVDKKLFEIEKKELKLENERLLEHIICKDVVNIVMHADVKSDNVLPVQNTFLDDNIALHVMKMENDRLIELLVSQDLVHTAVNSLAVINNYKSMEKSYDEAYNQCLELETELSKRNNMIEQDDAPEFRKFFIINELEAQLQAKNTTIMLKLDLEQLSSKLKNNREAHVDYIKITKENTDTLCDIVEQARTSNPLDNALAYACMYTKQIQELLVYVSDICPSSPLKSEKLVAVTPMNKARKVTFAKISATSENNIQTRVDLHKTETTNKPLVPFTSVKIILMIADQSLEVLQRTLRTCKHQVTTINIKE